MPSARLVTPGILILSTLLLASCGRAPSTTAQVRQYETRGIVQGMSPDRTTIDIQHENIPGFMPAMTMSFPVLDRKEIANLKTGSAISFRMNVTNTEVFIDNVKAIPASEVHVAKETVSPGAVSSSDHRLQEGDTVPSFSLIDQEGKPVTQETFRGKPYVLTFIFTRCPMPKFCPLMSSNFAELQDAIKNGSGSLAQTKLLSITLDPAFDTSQILKDYGAISNADSAIWKLATGEPSELDKVIAGFSVYRQTEGGTISHGLATALITPQGIIKKIWRGNEWKPAEVINVIGTMN